MEAYCNISNYTSIRTVIQCFYNGLSDNLVICTYQLACACVRVRACVCMYVYRRVDMFVVSFVVVNCYSVYRK